MRYIDNNERRIAPRSTINAPGTLTPMLGMRLQPSVRCTVIDISESGALIQTSTPITAEDFYLEMSTHPGERITCHAVRTAAGNRIGVQFAAPWRWSNRQIAA